MSQKYELKHIESWIDKEDEIENHIYTLNGVKLVHSLNPTTKDINISVVFEAGSAFEKESNVPNGTAHFLEHLLFNPNSEFKTREEIVTFESGNRERPEIFMNASTTKRFIYFYGNGNEKGAYRIIQRLKSALNSPLKDYSEHVDKERRIILSERMSLPKVEKDPYINYVKFLIGGNLTQFASNIIGEVDEIEKITTDDLDRYHNENLTKSNVVIAIQSRSELDSESLGLMADIINKLPLNEHKKTEKYVHTNFLKYKHFFKESEEGIFLSFNYFRKYNKKIDYRERVLMMLLRRLIYKYGHDKLREEKQIIYGIETFSNSLTTFTLSEGFKMSTSLENLGSTLTEVIFMLKKGMLELLDSEQGPEWFEGVISNYIFPRTKEFDPEYAESLAVTVLLDAEIFKFEEARKVAKNLKISDFKDFIHKQKDLLKPHIWAVSSYKDEEIDAVVKEHLPHLGDA